MIIQLNPPIGMSCPKGKGLCHFLIDYGMESHLFWVIAIDETGEWWTYSNPEVRIQNNISLGREVAKKPIDFGIAYRSLPGSTL